MRALRAHSISVVQVSNTACLIAATYLLTGWHRLFPRQQTRRQVLDLLSRAAQATLIPTCKLTYMYPISRPNPAGEFLKRSWERDSHPYDKSTPPWTQLKPLIADDRFFYIEPAPGKPNSQHVTLDLLDLLLKFPSIARRSSSNGGMLQVLALSFCLWLEQGCGAQEC
jgi:hypothetical protein